MTCSRCGADCPAGAKFCGECGAPLAMPGFRELTAPNLRTPGTLSTLPGEMKQVTVLFCDIVNSTPLTERLGAEGMRDLVHKFLGSSLAIGKPG